MTTGRSGENFFKTNLNNSGLYIMPINVINRTSSQKQALAICEEKRPQFTRVSPIWLDELNRDVILLIEDRILHNTSKQKTLR